MTIKKILIGVGVLVLVVAAVVGSFFGFYIYPVLKEMKITRTIPYDDKLTLITGGGGNTGILVSDSLVLVIDTKMDDAAVQLADQIEILAGDKPVFVVNTHIHSDHISGNIFFKGQTILAGGDYEKEAWIKENGEETLPTKWLKGTMSFQMGDEKVTIFNLGYNAHTQSDVMVYLHQRKMLFGGDVILNKQAPAMFAKFKADPEGYLNAFDQVNKQFEIKVVVPGHGDIGGQEIITDFRTYFNDIKTASVDPSKEKEVVKKYETWCQIPFIMAPAANISYVKELGEK